MTLCHVERSACEMHFRTMLFCAELKTSRGCMQLKCSPKAFPRNNLDRTPSVGMVKEALSGFSTPRPANKPARRGRSGVTWSDRGVEWREIGGGKEGVQDYQNRVIAKIEKPKGLPRILAEKRGSKNRCKRRAEWARKVAPTDPSARSGFRLRARTPAKRLKLTISRV